MVKFQYEILHFFSKETFPKSTLIWIMSLNILFFFNVTTKGKKSYFLENLYICLQAVYQFIGDRILYHSLFYINQFIKTINCKKDKFIFHTTFTTKQQTKHNLVPQKLG